MSSPAKLHPSQHPPAKTALRSSKRCLYPAEASLAPDAPRFGGALGVLASAARLARGGEIGHA